MNGSEMLEFINKCHIGFLATSDGGAARVRGMDTYRADESGLVFYTSKGKDVFKQLARNPEVEVLYYANGTQVRVRGKIEVVEDLALKKEIVTNRDFLKPMYPNDAAYANMGVCRLKGKATSWSMQDMTAPTTFIDL